MAVKRSYLAILIMALAAFIATGIVGCGGGGGGGSSSDPIPTPTPTIITYTLTVTVQGQGTVAPESGTTYENGETAILTPTPSDNWVFSSWSGTNGSEIVNNRIVMDGDKQVTATFVRPAYDLSVNVTGTGTVTQELVAFSRDEYQNGETVRLTPTAGAGWVFKQWEGDLTGTDNPALVTVDSAKTITAVFEVASVYGLDTTWGVNGEVTGFAFLMGLARASNGDLYVSDYGTDNVFTISADGSTVTTWAWTAAGNTLRGIAIGPSNNIYICDYVNDRVEVFSAADTYTGVFGSTTAMDGPFGLDLDDSGNLYVSNYSGNSVQKFPPGGGAAAYTLLSDGSTNFLLNHSTYIGSAGELYVCDFGNNRLLEFNADNGAFVGAVSLYSPTTFLPGPTFMCEDSNGFLYVCDYNNDLIHKIASDGTTYAIGEGILNAPEGIAVDELGNLYVVDQGNARVVKLKATE